MLVLFRSQESFNESDLRLTSRFSYSTSVTVSTVGIASKIRQLTKELPEVSLALSLHAPNQRLRSKIVPTAKQYPIQDMIDALDGHMMAYRQQRPNDPTTYHRDNFTMEERMKESTRRRAMIEYVMCKFTGWRVTSRLFPTGDS
jgi:adenine C2-methylase RlmN of 23S rRNA A2503 and tRNA A37